MSPRASYATRGARWVVSSPGRRKDEIEEAICLSQERHGAERQLIRLHKAGGSTIDLCNLTEVLKAKGHLVEQALGAPRRNSAQASARPRQ